jgi:hypothetical protein
VKRMLAAVFQSAPLLQSKFWTCLYASTRARAAASARAFAAAAAIRSLSPVPEEEGVESERRRRRRDATGSRRRGRSAGSIGSNRTLSVSVARSLCLSLVPSCGSRPWRASGPSTAAGGPVARIVGTRWGPCSRQGESKTCYPSLQWAMQPVWPC